MSDHRLRTGVRGIVASIGSVVLLLAVMVGCSSEGPGPGPEPCQRMPPVDGAVNVSWKPPLVPVKVSLSSSGKIAVALTADWVTPLGTFSVGAEASHTFAKGKNTSYLLVVRAVEDGVLKETGYEIDCRREYRVFLDGEFVQVIGLERTTITVTPGTASTIVVVDAASNLDPDMRPLPEFQALPSKGFTLPDPLGISGLGVDLDTHDPNVDEYVVGSGYDTSDADLWYGFGDGLEAGFEASFGRTDRPDPSAEDCRADARGNSVGALDPEAFAVGQRFCVLTSAGNVTLLVLTAFSGPYADRYEVSFDVAARWQKVR